MGRYDVLPRGAKKVGSYILRRIRVAARVGAIKQGISMAGLLHRGQSRIYFIRHGETEWSIAGRHTGRTDIPLTARGEDKARDIGHHLSNIPFAIVMTSPRQRARRTCELARLGPIVVVAPDLAEWDYGDYEGMRSLDICSQTPGWNLFQDGCPGGETPARIAERARDRLIARLRPQKGNLALFSHGHFGRVMAARWIGLPVHAGEHFLLDTASISALGYEPNHPQVPVIALWNAGSGQGALSKSDLL